MSHKQTFSRDACALKKEPTLLQLQSEHFALPGFTVVSHGSGPLNSIETAAKGDGLLSGFLTGDLRLQCARSGEVIRKKNLIRGYTGFLARAQPQGQSPFLFSIVFGNNRTLTDGHLPKIRGSLELKNFSQGSLPINRSLSGGLLFPVRNPGRRPSPFAAVSIEFRNPLHGIRP